MCVVLRMVAPCLVMVISPVTIEIILSIPMGPREVQTTSATTLATTMFAQQLCSLSLLIQSYRWKSEGLGLLFLPFMMDALLCSNMRRKKKRA